MKISIWACVLVALAAACGAGRDDTVPTGPLLTDGPGPLATCGTSTALFTVAPVSFTDLLGWVPLGNMNPPGHLFPTDHQYLYINNPEDASSVRPVTVVSPGNVTITRAHRTHYSTSDTYDYAIEFAPCAEVRAEFGHVTTIAPAVLEKMGAFDQECGSYGLGLGTDIIFTNCFTKALAVTVAAGDTIGTTGGQGTSFALDFGLYDSRTPPLQFANPARWEAGTSRLHTVPASDYFAEPARSVIRTRLGSYNGSIIRTAEPVGGAIAYDVAGTVEGIWINPAQPTFPEGAHLAIVPDVVVPSVMDISIGTSQPGFPPGLYQVTPASSGFVNRHPAQIVPDGNIYCFEFTQSRGVLLARLDDASTLRVEGRSGGVTCADQAPWAFGAKAFVYKR